jgi:hydroxymethylpyrimidine/phosphomethylpyrimidine kinase
MSHRRTFRTALTIAGSDSGGGAGVQADLKTFAALGVHGTTAITCVTAQNPRRVASVQAIRPEIVRDQIEAVFSELRPHAIKTGMLYSEEIIRTVAVCLRAARVPVVVDPVMVSTSGARLLRPSATKRLLEELLPVATLVTPNLDEATILAGHPLETVEDLRGAAREICGRYGCATLVKGGHLRGGREAVDFFYDGRTELMLTSEFVRGVSTHGTGCTYSAAVTAGLARGLALSEAVTRAKSFICRVIAESVRVRRHWVLGF